MISERIHQLKNKLIPFKKTGYAACRDLARTLTHGGASASGKDGCYHGLFLPQICGFENLRLYFLFLPKKLLNVKKM